MIPGSSLQLPIDSAACLCEGFYANGSLSTSFTARFAGEGEKRSAPFGCHTSGLRLITTISTTITTTKALTVRGWSTSDIWWIWGDGNDATAPFFPELRLKLKYEHWPAALVLPCVYLHTMTTLFLSAPHLLLMCSLNSWYIVYAYVNLRYLTKCYFVLYLTVMQSHITTDSECTRSKLYKGPGITGYSKVYCKTMRALLQHSSLNLIVKLQIKMFWRVSL